jgi:hypothetical protein
MIVLDEKFVFHIPLSRFSGGKLIPIDIADISEELLEELSANGFDSLYITNTRGYYKSRCFDELLITIFTSKDDLPVSIFVEWFEKHNDVLGQEALAYSGEMRWWY